VKSRPLIHWFLSAIAIAVPAIRAQQLNRTGSFLNLKESLTVHSRYFGDSFAAQSLAGGSAKPLSLATADFDEDGMPDLVSGYATAGGAGAVSIHRGNVEALWPYGAALRNGTPSAFLPDVRAVALPEAPDFLGAGDFDADGHWDIVTAKLGGHALYLLRGDGHGGFAQPERIDLPGAVTALTTGEINRLDGLTDIAVGITADAGAQVLVFESPAGALRGKPETLSVPEAVTSMVMASLDDSGMNSLAVAIGNDLVIFHGRDRRLSHTRKVRDAVPPAEMTRQSFPFALRALAAGNFTSTLLDLAVLGDDGKVRFLERPDADYQAAVAAGPLAIADPRRGKALRRTARNGTAALSAKPKSRELILRAEVALPSSSQNVARLIAARTSVGQGDDLLALDGASGQIHFLSRGASETARPEHSMVLSASIARPGGGVAALLPMRLQPAAFHSLVLVHHGGVEPAIAATSSPTVFTVTNTADSGSGSLRDAITSATAAGGPTGIAFNIPTSDPGYNAATGVFTIQPLQALPTLPAGCTLDGYTQPGAIPNTSLLAAGVNALLNITINGSLAGPGADGIKLSSGTSTVRGLIITGFQANGSALSGFGVNLDSQSNFVEGNFLGVDQTGFVVNGNNIGAGGTGGAAGNTIGGTTPQARNLMAGNIFANIASAVVSTPGTYLIEGNYFGTDRTGKNALGGLGVNQAGQGMIVGGTSAGASNLLSGTNGLYGVALNFATGNAFTPDGNLVQGNFIGTDDTGTATVVNNNSVGVFVSGGNKNLIGGTTAAARNIISGNTGDGIEVLNGSAQTLIQGNYIGVDVSSAVQLGNAADGINHAGLNGTANGDETLIGGEVAGSANVISANGGNGIELGGATPDANGMIGSTVLGNLIGTDTTGTIAMGNSGSGILIDQGGSNFVIGNIDVPAANTIAYNGADGVTINPALDPSTGSSTFSIPVFGTSVTNNSIFSNGGAGVRIPSGNSNTVSRNSISFNSNLGIDVDAPGPLVNSTTCPPATNGANNLQNAPALTATGSAGDILISATATDASGNTSEFSQCLPMALQQGNANALSISGSLNGQPSTAYRIEFFSNATCDPSGFGQGMTFLTAMSVTTDASCHANLTGIVTDPDTLTATGGTPQTGVTNSAFLTRLQVTLLDPKGNPLSGQTVTFSAPSSGASASLSSQTATTDFSGSASIQATANGVLGSYTVTASAPAFAGSATTITATFSLTNATPTAGAVTATGGTPQSAAINTAFAAPLQVAVTDTRGNGIGGVILNFSAPFSGASANLSSATATTNASGIATVNAIANSVAGSYTVTATTGSFSATFALTNNAGPAVSMTATAGTPQMVAVTTVATALQATVMDSFGNGVPGVQVTFAAPTSGATGTFAGSTTVTTNSKGVATAPTFTANSTFGAYQVTATAGSLSAVFNLTNVVGPPAIIKVLAGSPQSATINTTFATAFSVQVTDIAHNPISGLTVTFTPPVGGAGGAFSGSSSLTTDANGTVTAPAFTANTTAGSYPVTVAVGSLSTGLSLTNNPGPPSQMIIAGGNSQNAAIGTAFATALAVKITDQYSNPIGGIAVTFTAPLSGATGTFASTAVVQTNLLGIATAPTFTANGTLGTYQVTAAGAGMSAIFQLTNTPVPIIVTPASLAFSSSGTPPAPQSLTLSSGGTPIPFTITGAPSWLTLQSSGTTPAAITVAASAAGLPLGLTRATLIVTPGNGAPVVPVPIAITVSSPADLTLVASPSSVSFVYQGGGALPPDQAVSISNQDGTPASNYRLIFSSPANWLSATSSGSTVRISVNPANLAPGRYGTVISVTTGTATVSVPVSLSITDAPLIQVSRPSLDFSYTAGGPLPAPQVLAVSSTIRPVFFTATPGSSGWLSVSPANGTTLSQLLVSVNPKGLSPGFHTDTILIQSADTTNTSLTVTVTLFIGP